MNDDWDQALLFETLAASLELDRKEQHSLIESLALMLSGALPENVTVVRGGWFLAREKPVERVLVQFTDIHYEINRQKNTSKYSARVMKIVRGVVLKTTELELSECVESIVRELSAEAEKNARMRAALQKFIGA